MKKLLVLAAALACTAPAFAFSSTQGQTAINKEVSDRIANKESMESIAGTAKKDGVQVNPLSIALKYFGSADKVLEGLLSAGYDASAAINALVALGGDRDALVKTAIAKNVDPTTITASTAAGGNNNGNNAGGLAGFAGFSGNSFGQSRAATVGGGGKNGVSGS